MNHNKGIDKRKRDSTDKHDKGKRRRILDLSDEKNSKIEEEGTQVKE
jgi:hypothetical protein